MPEQEPDDFAAGQKPADIIRLIEAGVRTEDGEMLWGAVYDRLRKQFGPIFATNFILGIGSQAFLQDPDENSQP